MFDRFAVDFSAEVKQPDAPPETSFAQCCDVSASGAGLLSDEKLIPDTDLEIWLGIPDGHPPFRGLARVVWSKQVRQDKWHSGLEFKTVDFMGLRRVFGILTKKA